MTILAYLDGASRGNPGESGVGIVLKDEQGNLIKSYYGYIGKATNNIAEYKALLACLKLVSNMECSNLVIHSDSELMVRQLNGLYKVKDLELKKLFLKAQRILEKLPFEFSIKYVEREKNREADQLANRGIDTKKKLQV